jgi:hypothetical protein
MQVGQKVGYQHCAVVTRVGIRILVNEREQSVRR